MSVAGIAIAIGDVADMGIIMTENIYRHLAERRDEAARAPGCCTSSTRRRTRSGRRC